jgi:gamma-glutamyltranspeptidase/glutathione hydrolase
MVAYLAKSKRVVALDFDARAPLAYREDTFNGDAKEKSAHGYLAVTAPAIVAGLSTALKEFGTKSWKECTARALELAENGCPMDPYPRAHLNKWAASVDPVSRRALFGDAKIPDAGAPWVQKDLAKLFRALASDGPESFYHGEIPRRIVKQVREHGGILAEEDFTQYQPTIVEPLTIDYRGHQLFTPPPPSGGVTMLQILKTLEQFDIGTMEPWSAAYMHLVIEASKRCWADRQRTLGDPDFVAMELDKLLSAKSARARAAEIRLSDASRGVDVPVDSNPHTSNISAIDREGNICSMTATQGAQFGSYVVIDGLGLILGHGMSRFEYSPRHPNRPAPGKRPHHNMSPTVMLKDGEPFGAVGMPGAQRIITVTAQLIANLVDFGVCAETAVKAPRVHTDGSEPLEISSRVDESVKADLIAMKHRVERPPSGQEYTDVGGPANVVVVREGQLSAASEAGPAASCVL